MNAARLPFARNWRHLLMVIALVGGLSILQAETSPTPKPKTGTTSSSKKKKKASPSPKPSKTPVAKKKKTEDNEEATPTPGRKKSAKKLTAAEKKKLKASASASAHASAKREEIKKEAASLEEPALPSATPSPSATVVATAAQSFSAIPQVNVEKSGYLGEQGFEPPPVAEKRRGWWFWSRPAVQYKYLSRSLREELDRAPVMRRRWQFIVVHNTGTKQGSARVFDYYHKHVRRMQNGLAYHFVIGNGTSTGDGEIEIGDRWRRQINGGHVHSDYLNNIALGICLVGDFNRSQPTPRQLEATEELIKYLRKRCGKTDRGEILVRPHREVNPPQWATDCPGDDFPYSWFRRF